MKPIEFDILWWDNDQSQLNDLGIHPEVSNADTRVVLFYSIDTISPYFEGGNDYTAIRSGGDEYIVAKTYQEVKNLVG